MSLTQNRLATGKKVNTALDNPSNFFTSQSLSNRAGDLNALLDSIGQAQQTLDAADNGITSLTKLVESAKSIAKQARQSAQPTSNTFGQITVTGTAQAEVARHGHRRRRRSRAAELPTTYAFTIDINGAGTRPSLRLRRRATRPRSSTACIASFDGTVTASALTGADHRADASSAGDGIRVTRSTPTSTSWSRANAAWPTRRAASTSGTYNSTSLLDRIVDGRRHRRHLDPGRRRSTAAPPSTITFGTGAGPDLDAGRAERRARQRHRPDRPASSGTVTSFVVGASSMQNNLTLDVVDRRHHRARHRRQRQPERRARLHGRHADPTRASLQTDYNELLAQIDALAKDASYNGINLLLGDNLKVVFNENGHQLLDHRRRHLRRGRPRL